MAKKTYKLVLTLEELNVLEQYCDYGGLKGEMGFSKYAVEEYKEHKESYYDDVLADITNKIYELNE